MTAVYDALTAQEKQEVRMYGCTEAQMREAVEQSMTYRFSGPAIDRKSTRLNSSHSQQSRMPSSA